MRKYSFRNLFFSCRASDPSVPTHIFEHCSTLHELTNFTYTLKLDVDMFIRSFLGTCETLLLVPKVKKLIIHCTKHKHSVVLNKQCGDTTVRLCNLVQDNLSFIKAQNN